MLAISNSQRYNGIETDPIALMWIITLSRWNYLNVIAMIKLNNDKVEIAIRGNNSVLKLIISFLLEHTLLGMLSIIKGYLNYICTKDNHWKDKKKEENDTRWKSLFVVHQSNILANCLCLKASSLSPHDCEDYIVVKSTGIYMRNARNKILMRRIWMRRCSRRDCSSGWPPIQDLFSFLPSFRRQIMRLSLRRVNLVTLTFPSFFTVIEYIMSYFITFVRDARNG